MKLLPTPERIRAASATAGDQGLGQGAEIAIGLLVFFGIGAGIDWLAGTTPVFMIVLTLFCAVGQFVRVWYGYDSRMRSLEAQRTQAATAHQIDRSAASEGAGS